MSKPAVSPKIIICADDRRAASPWARDFLNNKILKAGLMPSSIQTLTPQLAQFVTDNVVFVGLGELALRAMTDKKGIDKWCLSPLKTNNGQTFIPTFDMEQVTKQPELGLYQELAFRRAHEAILSAIKVYDEKFILSESVEESCAILGTLISKPELSVDVETGYGQINTVGFAWSDTEAIAIKIPQEDCDDIAHHELWKRIATVLEGDSKKIFQNFIYDCSYFSAYGIRVKNINFDTMWAQRLLYPQFDCDLANIGRMWTHRRYWKDDGKILNDEGKRAFKWGNVVDWFTHLTYNCKDTTATFEVKQIQERELHKRGLWGLYQVYQELFEPILEMCAEGMLYSPEKHKSLVYEIQQKHSQLEAEFKSITGFNHASPKKLKEYLSSKKIKIPKKYDSKTKSYKESVGANALEKLINKNKTLPELAILRTIRDTDKQLKALDIDQTSQRITYSLNGCANTSLGWSCSKDSFGRGCDITKIIGDKNLRQILVVNDVSKEKFFEISPVVDTEELARLEGPAPRSQRIKDELWNTRRISSPTGWNLYHYSRITPQTVVEAESLLDEHLTNWLTNRTIVLLQDFRACHNSLRFNFVLSTGSTLILRVQNESVDSLVSFLKDLKLPYLKELNVHVGTTLREQQ